MPRGLVVIAVLLWNCSPQSGLELVRLDDVESSLPANTPSLINLTLETEVDDITTLGVSQRPASGEIELINRGNSHFNNWHYIKYTPDSSFVGSDQATLVINGSFEQVVKFSVNSTTSCDMGAISDHIVLSQNTALDNFNLSANDRFCVQIDNRELVLVNINNSSGLSFTTKGDDVEVAGDTDVLVSYDQEANPEDFTGTLEFAITQVLGVAEDADDLEALRAASEHTTSLLRVVVQ